MFRTEPYHAPGTDEAFASGVGFESGRDVSVRPNESKHVNKYITKTKNSDGVF